MAKYMEIKFDNGETWRFPAFLIADDRADYYANRDAGEDKSKFDELRQEEWDYTMSRDDELEDWFANNMSWADVKSYAIRMPKEDKPFDYEAGLEKAECKLVDTPDLIVRRVLATDKVIHRDADSSGNGIPDDACDD